MTEPISNTPVDATSIQKRVELAVEAYGRELRLVRSAAVVLLNTHPDETLVSVNRGSSLSARVKFSSEIAQRGGVDMVLSISITPYGGSFTESIRLEQDGVDEEDGEISYRLDIARGREVETTNERMAGVVDSSQNIDSQRRMRAMMEAMFETGGDGELTQIADNYAESNVSVKTVLLLLKNATDVKPDDGDPFDRSITLRQFRELLKASQASAPDNLLLDD